MARLPRPRRERVGGGLRARPRRAARAARRVRRGEIEGGARVRRPARDDDAGEDRARAPCSDRVAPASSRSRRARRALRRGRRAGRAHGGPAGRVLTDAECRFVAATQEQLYSALDLDLSWSGRDLPERIRTKHVHRLHPYLGKYIPQLVEELFRRHVPARGRVLDPFAGSGTTLVQALESGLDSTGVDIAAFNCLLMRVKTTAHAPFVLDHELRDALARFERGEGSARDENAYLRTWFAPRAREELLRFRSLVADYEHADVLRVVLARAARSARLTTHFDLDFPKAPQVGPYWCHKHRRECRPVERAEHFIRRYALDSLARIKAFARVRAREHGASVLHGDARPLA